MSLSRLNYDKMHRCPTWSGGGWTYARDVAGKCDASFASFMYARPHWRWRFIRCPKCQVTCLPYVTRWLDPAWLRWRLSRHYRAIYRRH